MGADRVRSRSGNTAPVDRRGDSRLARWAVGLATMAVVVVAVSYGVFAVAYVLGGVEATEDNWVGALAAIALYVGLIMSLAAFGLAIAVTRNRQRWAALWFPLLLFPALLAILIVAETLWLE